MVALNVQVEKRRHPRYAWRKKSRRYSQAKCATISKTYCAMFPPAGGTIDSAFELEASDPMGLKTKDLGLFGAKVTRPFDDDIGVRVIHIDEIEEKRLLADLADLDAQIPADQF